ncbi:hypothetical protein [Isoptericola halotolerans]|uniref:Site-specific DNA-cytosine methylase n=1 Tax=Isoptericola halotolerans TaxID=300560 RepID=A0ABX2A927_9MICO|nr:hypothetical protein [Isoptericola halotolerans]NOV98191.1 site-specific DNA-cytosine methylase [Isoptericola halotolerans]
MTLLPTPTTRDGKGRNQRGDDTCLPGALLPTPRATDGTKGGPNQRGSSGDLMLPSAVRLMPTPRATHWAKTSERARVEYGSSDSLPDLVDKRTFGQYADAIARWEPVVGRPAPAPTEPTGKGGVHRLSPRFVEWMMGLPDGWVTDVGLSRSEQLKALGNGVVPQQAEAALGHMLTVRSLEAVTS